MKTQLIPYLTFENTTAEVMKFYKSIFGGELVLQTFEEAKMAGDREDMKDLIIHAQLTTDDITIMASDTDPAHSSPVVVGNNVNLSLIGADEPKLREYFEKLSEGGKIEMHLEKQFWGDLFGACEDKHGIHWMVNISATGN